jgi:hypothetical protein
MEDSKSHKTAIIVAIIGFIGVISASLIANWDKLIPPANRASVVPATSHTPVSSPVDLPSSAEKPVKASQPHFLGALDGIYVSDKKDELEAVWEKRTFSLLHFNCNLEGNLVEHDDSWGVVVVKVDGVCSIIDDDDIGKEVGKITPVKGAMANSGRVTKALLNFHKASLGPLSGVYELK